MTNVRMFHVSKQQLKLLTKTTQRRNLPSLKLDQQFSLTCYLIAGIKLTNNGSHGVHGPTSILASTLGVDYVAARSGEMRQVALLSQRGRAMLRVCQ